MQELKCEISFCLKALASNPQKMLRKKLNTFIFILFCLFIILGTMDHLSWA